MTFSIRWRGVAASVFLVVSVLWFGGACVAQARADEPPLTAVQLGVQRTLKLLEEVPIHETDKGEPEWPRHARMTRKAVAINDATRDHGEQWIDPDARAALITLARYESHLALYVYENRCADGPRGKYECDSGKAKGIFQIHANRDWPEIPDDVETQAIIAAKLWRGHYYRCARSMPEADRVAAAFAAYGSGGTCAVSEWAETRAHYWRGIRARL